ncbi:DinB family protein [Flavobacterium faecale]|uniref:DinB family protein n=1 Tax=Flavobacterium faecale TaxID=1355330 RepID=UPI003AAB43B1
METNTIYLESAKKLFLYYKTLGEKAIEQIEPEQLFTQTNEDTNSIATIVKHLSGNMLSRWTDFLTTDGEKEWRNRDSEFENNLTTKEAVFESWNKGWECFLTTLDNLHAEQLLDIIYIRNEGHTVLEAINRQLAHYSYHVGQLVFYAKELKNKPWNSLSIARNNSQNYNSDKFAKAKEIKNFTDAEIKRMDKQ